MACHRLVIGSNVQAVPWVRLFPNEYPCRLARKNQILNHQKVCQPQTSPPHRVESSASPFHHHLSSPSIHPLLSSPLPPGLSSASHTEAQSGQRSSSNASDVKSGRFRLHIHFCRAGRHFNFFDSTPSSPTAASPQSFPSSSHWFFPSSSPRHGLHRPRILHRPAPSTLTALTTRSSTPDNPDPSDQYLVNTQHLYRVSPV